MSGHYWEVVGGADKGGILVRTGKETASSACPDRLSTGAVVEHLSLDGARLHYRRVTGTGPEEGWISTRLEGPNGKELAKKCVIWEVSASTTKGAVVREAQDVNSKSTPERLGPGALVKETRLVGVRLKFDLVRGDGPATGWVSVKLDNGKELLTKYTPAEPPPGAEEGPGASTPAAAPALVADDDEAVEKPRGLRPHRDVAPKFKACGRLPLLKPQPNVKKFKEACGQQLPGMLYGLKIPNYVEDLVGESFGPEWLTQAFHKAGSLPENNAVTRIVKWRHFEGGGSGPKVLFEVEYKEPSDELDTTLFAKFPWTLEVNEHQKVTEQGRAQFGDNWGGEINFYRFVSPYVPFPVPTFYFGDTNRDSHQAVIINAGLPWPEEGKTDFKPYELLPPCGKCEDFLLTQPPVSLKDPADYYYAIMKRQGTIAGLGKQGGLGPDLNKIEWYDFSAKADIFCSFSMPGNEKQLRLLIEEFAPHIFPESMRKKEFLDKLDKQMPIINKAQPEIVEYIYANKSYVGFQHQNGNTDNAYFYRRADGAVAAGMLDFGSFARLAFASAFQGSFCSGLGEMVAEHDDNLVRCWLDAYHATGAPKLDFEELVMQYRCVSCVGIYGTFASARQFANAGSKEGLWDWVKAWNDDYIRQDFGLKFNIGMLYNRALLWSLRGDTYYAAYEKMKSKKA